MFQDCGVKWCVGSGDGWEICLKGASVDLNENGNIDISK